MPERKPKIINDLRRWILENYGKRCPEYAPLCIVCEAWRAYDVLDWTSPNRHKRVPKK